MKLDAMYPREYELNGEKKTHWMPCGIAFTKQDGSVDVLLYTVPCAKEQQDGSMAIRLQLREPRPRDEAPRTSRPMVEHKRYPSKPQPSSDNSDDNIPF